jgi:predicted ABC-type transport system involved in lysophospholipase L1 biosynthesis ATPase subunit
MSAFVALDDVSHVYGGAGGTLAVEGLTLSVGRGEFAAVVGPSGCGKSTLMKLATGLQFPFKGTVDVAGARVSKPVKIAGMAFQAPTLLPWRTTLENLLLPLEIVEPHRSQIRRKKAEYVARAEALLASVGLGGAKQQISLGAFRRHADARLALPRAHPRAATAHARRAVRRARCIHARRALVRGPRSAGGEQDHRHPRHARFARGRVPGRPHFCHVGAAGQGDRRAGGGFAAPARTRHDLHAGIPEHRARFARADREARQ